MKALKGFIKKYSRKTTHICLVVLFAVFFILVLMNDFSIQFLMNHFQKVSNQPLQVYFLDVGQASANVIILPTRKTLVIDTGSSESQEEFIEGVDEILSRNKLSKIDMLLLTHSDEDHVGGAVALMKEYQVDLILRPKILSTSQFDRENGNYKRVDSYTYKLVVDAAYSEPNCQVKFITDEIFVEAECAIEIFSCKENSYNQTNSYCPFVTIKFQDKAFMFCGDATEVREKEFLDQMKNEQRKLKVDFLLVSHHGSKTSSTESFLEFIAPSYAIISAGDAKHPHSDVLKRLFQVGVSKIFCTKDDGMVGIGVNSNGTFIIMTMSVYIDLPLMVCIIFLVGAVWYYYFMHKKAGQKIFLLKENRLKIFA